MTIDLNCDLGEGTGNDAAIMPFISSANIACGYHAGGEKTIRETIQLCLLHNVAIGAHPGFADKKNFGRKPIQLPDTELYELVWKQLDIMQTICAEMGASLHHVKPHGALYNMAANNGNVSAIIAKAVRDFNQALWFYGLSGSVMLTEAAAVGLKTAREVFADRTYQADGTLTPRTHAKALIVDTKQAVSQVAQLVNQHSVTTVDGHVITIHADTVCLHGDGVQAVTLAGQIYRNLLREGVTIAPLST